MNIIPTSAARIACVVAILCAIVQGCAGVEPRSSALAELPLEFTNIDVTHDASRRFGAPHVAVNARDPNNVVVLASMSLGYTGACLPAAPGSDCEMITVNIPGAPPGMGGVSRQPRGFARTPGFMDIGVFVSFDRGRTFQHVDVSSAVPPDHPMVRARGEGPIVAMPDGSFMIGFNALNWGEPENPTLMPDSGVGVIKSTDGGRTWQWTSFTGTPADWPFGGEDPITGTFYVTSGIAGIGPRPRPSTNETTPSTGINDRWVSSSQDGRQWTPRQPLGGDDGGHHVEGGHTNIASAYGVMATMFVSRNCAFFVQSQRPTCVVFQSSTDAGRTWTRSMVPTAEAFQAAPFSLFVAADPSRRNHFTATLTDGASILIFRTPDAGRTWTGPVTITNDPEKNHFSSFVAFSSRGEFGVMWRTHEPVPGQSPAPAPQAGGNPFMQGPALPYSVWAAVSRDGGATFSRPLRVSHANSPAPPSDPNDAFRIVGDHGPSGIALDGQGAVHVVWADWTSGERGISLASINIRAFEH